MKFNVHAGHNPAGMIACGAVGIIDESAENRAVKDRVIQGLKALGHEVYDCTCNDGSSQNDVLAKIVSKCNSHNVDYDISIHFNAGGGRGTECWVYPNGGSDELAENICSAISDSGFRNRGVKQTKDLYVLSKTKSKALLIECCFVDSSDAELYNADNMANAIIKGLTGEEPVFIDTKDYGNSEPFFIRVKMNLNIRKGPGVEYDVVGVISDRLKYTIVETARSSDGGTWGKLKSGAGWINVGEAYCSRV